MLRRATRPALEFIDIHAAQVYRVVPKDPCTSFLNYDIDSRHFVPLLFPRTELEVVVQSNDTTIEISALVARRVE